MKGLKKEREERSEDVHVQVQEVVPSLAEER